MVEVYKDTIAPASLVGLAYTTSGALFAGWVGGLVDRMTRMRFVRLVISLRKVSDSITTIFDDKLRIILQILQVANYSLFFSESAFVWDPFHG